MGNIIGDIVEEIDIKPNKSKLILKWVIGIAISLIGIAFALGQFKSSFFGRMDEFEKKLDANTVAIEKLEESTEKKFLGLNEKISNMYSDGTEIFENFQAYNNKQLELIVDYGSSNKDMLKDMLELNSLKMETEIKNKKIQGSATFEYSPTVERIIEVPVKGDECGAMEYLVNLNNKDTTIRVIGATQKYIDDIDKENFEIGRINKNKDNPNRYDFYYRKKRNK